MSKLTENFSVILVLMFAWSVWSSLLFSLYYFTAFHEIGIEQVVSYTIPIDWEGCVETYACRLVVYSSERKI